MVRIPEQDLHERILDLAVPLLERIGTNPSPEAVHDAVELAIAFWNAKARASTIWGTARTKPLNDLQRKLTGKKAPAEDAEAFELLSERWRDKELAFDPRLVGDWSLEVRDDEEPELSCEMELPDGVEAEIPPPIEKRVAIGGKFLDEVRIRLAGTSDTISLLSFPLQHHRGAIGDDGTVIVHTKMPTAVALLAEGFLPSVAGATVELMVQGREGFERGEGRQATIRARRPWSRREQAIVDDAAAPTYHPSGFEGRQPLLVAFDRPHGRVSSPPASRPPTAHGPLEDHVRTRLLMRSSVSTSRRSCGRPAARFMAIRSSMCATR